MSEDEQCGRWEMTLDELERKEKEKADIRVSTILEIVVWLEHESDNQNHGYRYRNCMGDAAASIKRHFGLAKCDGCQVALGGREHYVWCKEKDSQPQERSCTCRHGSGDPKCPVHSIYEAR